MLQKRFKRIIQMLPTLSSRDAIGEEAFLIDRFLKAWGFESEIQTLQVNFRQPVKTWENTLILYHFSIGSRLPYFLMEWKAPILLRYHNVTPPSFFNPKKEEGTVNACELGFQQKLMLSRSSLFQLPVSEFNARDLNLSVPSRSLVLPLLRDYRRFERSKPFVRKKAQFLFVGRLSPNKCQHDLLEILSLYKRFKDPQAKLILVGGGFSSSYSQSLLKFAEVLSLKLGEDLIFSHDLSEEELVKIYHESSVFLSMSEHEGFCAPLVEAMHAGLPIVAHRSSAIPETLGEAGVLLDKKDTLSILNILEKIHTDLELRNTMVQKGLQRAKFFSLDENAKRLRTVLENLKAP